MSIKMTKTGPLLSVVCSLLISVAWSSGCSRCDSEGAPGIQFDAKGKVVAHSSDGSFVVQRGKTIDVYAATGQAPKSLPIGNPDNTPGFWYDVSANARHVAFVKRDGGLQLWDTAKGSLAWKGDPGAAIGKRFEMNFVGPSSSLPASYGAPAFVGGDTLLTHHNGGVVVWDVASGKAKCSIQHPDITITRQTFVLDDQHIGIRCGSNNPGIANTTLFVASLSSCKVITFTAPHKEGAVGAVKTKSEMVTADRESVRIAQRDKGLLLKQKGGISTLSTCKDASRIIWGTSDGKVMLWFRQTNRLVSFDTGRDAGIVHVRDDGKNVHAIDAMGAVYRWPLPQKDQGEIVKPKPYDQDEILWQKALLLVGMENLAEASDLLVPMLQKKPTAPKYRMAALYLASIQAKENADAFARGCKKAGLDLGAKTTSSAMLEVVKDMMVAESTMLGMDLYMSWLATSPSAEDAQANQGIELGLSISSMLMSAEQYDYRSKLLRWMGRLFPKHKKLAEELKELKEEEQE